MFDPMIALQGTIGNLLAGTESVVFFVSPMNIRSGTVRGEDMPAIILSPVRFKILGHSYANQTIAECRMFLHIWTDEGNSANATSIASAVMGALIDPPKCEYLSIDDWERPEIVWGSDPDPARSFTYGTIAINAIVRWRNT